MIAELLWGEPDFFVRETLIWVPTRTPLPAIEAATAALQDSDPSTRQQVLHLFSKIAHPDSAAAVVGYIDDAGCGIAGKARGTLARIGDASVISALMSRLGQTDLAGRDAMTTTVSQFGVAATPALAVRAAATTGPIEALNHSDPSVRSHSVDVLCYIGDRGAQEAIPTLISLLQDEDPDVRLAATVALCEFSNVDAARKAIREASISHDDGRVRAVARASL